MGPIFTKEGEQVMNEDIQAAEAIQSIQLAQERKYTRIAEDHLAAVNARNLQAIGKTLHPDVQVVGPAGLVHNKDSFMEVYQKVFTHLEKVDVTAQSRLNNQSTSIYNLIFPTGQVPIHNVMTHEEDGLIRKIEMIYDTAMLQNHLNPKK
jgi:hypothetical protein